MWNEIKNEIDIENLMKEYSGFHDSCIVSINYHSGAFVNDKQDFHELYELMNGMPLREMDQIVYPVCTLCRDHERSGFIHGMQVGIRLAEELKK